MIEVPFRAPAATEIRQDGRLWIGHYLTVGTQL
jgi:hypothetical protein